MPVNRKLKTEKISTVRYSPPANRSFLNTFFAPGPGRKKRILITGSLILLLLIVIRLVMTLAVRKPKESTAVEIIPVEAAVALQETIHDTINLTERLQPYSEVNIFAPVPGWLSELYVDIGSKVYGQQVVATINRNIVGSEYARAIVKSPISGEVGKIYADIGANISPASPVLSVINYDTIKMYVNIPEKHVYHVQKGNKAVIHVESMQGELFEGEIKKVSSAIDPLSGTFQAKIEIPNSKHKLKPGIFADVSIIVAAKETCTVLQEAIADLETTKPYMFVITNNTASRRAVKIGIQDQGKVEILEGVKKDDLYILTGIEVARDGSRLNIVNAEKPGLVPAADMKINKKSDVPDSQKNKKKK